MGGMALTSKSRSLNRRVHSGPEFALRVVDVLFKSVFTIL